MTFILTILLMILVGIFWWLFFRVPIPEIPPLTVDDNDPLMLEAIATAKQNLTDFINLLEHTKNNAQVKFPFLTSSGQIEFLWGEVLQITHSNIEIRLLTPPITHTGQVERVQTHPLTDIVDWIILMENGEIKGGYTMRVMFKIAKEKWGELPNKLKAEELKYE